MFELIRTGRNQAKNGQKCLKYPIIENNSKEKFLCTKTVCLFGIGETSRLGIAHIGQISKI